MFWNKVLYIIMQNDNIVSHTSDEEEELLASLESDLSSLMSWFKKSF